MLSEPMIYALASAVVLVIGAIFQGCFMLLGAILGFALKWFLQTRQQNASIQQAAEKQRGDHQLSSDAQAVAIYRELVERCQQRIGVLEAKVEQLTKDYSECRERDAAHKTEIGALQGQVASLETKLAQSKELVEVEHVSMGAAGNAARSS